jgi:hypothetical protein
MHNTHEQNEAFRRAWDATNARWKAQTTNNIFVLNWVFCNGHAWAKPFETVEHAEQHAYQLGLFQSPTVERAWIDGPNGQTWLKEKTND